METSNLIWGAFLSMLAITILSTNAYIFFVVYKCKILQTRGNVFLLSLAFSDFSVALFNIPFTAASSFMPKLRASGNTLCNISGVLEMTFLIASVFSVTAMNFQRYIHITQWQRYYDIFSVRRVCRMVILMWIAAMALSFPPLFGLSKIIYKPGQSHCFVDWKQTPAYSFILMVTCFFAPVILLGYFYARIYQHRKCSKNEVKAIAERLSMPSTMQPSNDISKIGSNYLSQSTGNIDTTTKEKTCWKEGSKSSVAGNANELDMSDRKAPQSNLNTHICDNHVEKVGTSNINIKDEAITRSKCAENASVEIRIELGALGKRWRQRNLMGNDLKIGPIEHLAGGISSSVNVGIIMTSRLAEVPVLWKKHGKTFQAEITGKESEQEDIQICLDQSMKKDNTQSYPRIDSNYDLTEYIEKKPKISPRKKYLRVEARAEKEERKLAMMCIIIVAVFCMSWLPFVVTMFLDLLTDIDILPFAEKTTLVIGYMNSLANPIIYFYFNRSFRRHFSILTNCCKSKDFRP